jgi:hypothetical protein
MRGVHVKNHTYYMIALAKSITLGSAADYSPPIIQTFHPIFTKKKQKIWRDHSVRRINVDISVISKLFSNIPHTYTTPQPAEHAHYMYAWRRQYVVGQQYGVTKRMEILQESV